MSSIWTDLLFLHGYIRDHDLARRLADAPACAPPARVDGDRGPQSPAQVTGGATCGRLCLGIGDGEVRRQ